jgi:hypothetical protein
MNLYPFQGINSKNILKKSCLQECAKKWVAILAGTLLFCYYFRQLFKPEKNTIQAPTPTSAKLSAIQ